MRKRDLAAALQTVLALLLALGAGCSSHPGDEEYYHRSSWAMGSPVDIQLKAESPQQAETAFRGALEEIERIEQLLSDYRETSELSRINRLAGRSAVTVDPEMFAILSALETWHRESSGAFDPAVGALVDLWGFRSGRFAVPAPASVSQTLRSSGMSQVRLDSVARTVQFLAEDVRLDPGAFGKGYALDRAAGVLSRLGVESALLGIGRSSYLALGPPQGEPPWRILPDSSRPELFIELRDLALATSGASERSFVQNGVRYGHILDPRTGMPADIAGPVTVAARRGVVADVISTAMYVVGPDSARSLAAAWPDEFAFRFRDHPAASPPGATVY